MLVGDDDVAVSSLADPFRRHLVSAGSSLDLLVRNVNDDVIIIGDGGL